VDRGAIFEAAMLLVSVLGAIVLTVLLPFLIGVTELPTVQSLGMQFRKF
jgi:hypothetical protein